VLDAALQADLKGSQTAEKLLERIAVGYVWGEDTLDSSRFKVIFQSKAEEALPQISFFFWTISREDLEEEQVQRILQYWRQCLDWAAKQPTPPLKVLSSLSGLVSFLPDAKGKNYDLLSGIAPYVHAHHGSDEFLKELGRLAENSSKEICMVFRTFIETHRPDFDYENRLQKLIARLAERGYRSEAISFYDTLRYLPGCYEGFLTLTAKPPGLEEP
jgi:hypothetical protein